MAGEEESKPSVEQDWKVKYDELMKRYIDLLRIVDDGVFMVMQNLMNLANIVKQLKWQLEADSR